MIEIVWDTGFKQSLKKWLKKHPELKESFENQLAKFVEDPFHPSLKTHMLSGTLKGIWSFRINYSHRLIFHFNENQTIAILVDIGTHDEVY